jgi:hypothetical protein
LEKARHLLDANRHYELVEYLLNKLLVAQVIWLDQRASYISQILMKNSLHMLKLWTLTRYLLGSFLMIFIKLLMKSRLMLYPFRVYTIILRCSTWSTKSIENMIFVRITTYLLSIYITFHRKLPEDIMLKTNFIMLVISLIPYKRCITFWLLEVLKLI